MSYWKVAGLSYLQYVTLATTALRQVRPSTALHTRTLITSAPLSCQLHPDPPLCVRLRCADALLSAVLQAVKPTNALKYTVREEVQYKQQLWKDGKATTERGQCSLRTAHTAALSLHGEPPLSTRVHLHPLHTQG